MVYIGAILAVVSSVLLVVFCVAKKTSLKKLEEKYLRELAYEQNASTIFHSQINCSPKHLPQLCSPLKGSSKPCPGHFCHLHHHQQKEQMFRQSLKSETKFQNQAVSSISADCLKQHNYHNCLVHEFCQPDRSPKHHHSRPNHSSPRQQPHPPCNSCSHITAMNTEDLHYSVKKKSVQYGPCGTQILFEKVDDSAPIIYKSCKSPKNNLLPPLHFPLNRSNSAPQYSEGQKHQHKSILKHTEQKFEEQQQYLSAVSYQDENSPDNSSLYRSYSPDNDSSSIFLQVPMNYAPAPSPCLSSQSEVFISQFHQIPYSRNSVTSSLSIDPSMKRKNTFKSIKDCRNVRSIDNAQFDVSCRNFEFDNNPRIETREIESSDQISSVKQHRQSFRDAASDLQFSPKKQVSNFDAVSKVPSASARRKKASVKRGKEINERHAILCQQLSLPPQDQIYVNTIPSIERGRHLRCISNYSFDG